MVTTTGRATDALERVRPALTRFGPALAILVFQLVVFPMPGGVFVRGLTVGLLGALVAVGMALIFRANAIINFAQADLGSVPVVLVVNLIAFSGMSYWLAFPLGLVVAAAVGAVVELAVIRRFFDASRLILTVVTIGLATALAAAGLLLPRLWGERPQSLPLDIPWDVHLSIDPIVLDGDDLVALVLAPVAMVLLALFMRRTDIGVAVRAASERADRASLLGVPVRRLETVVWIIAAVLAFVGAYLRAGVVGLPIGGSVLTFGFLLRTLAALVLGRMTDLPAVAAAAVTIGLLEQGVGWNASSPLLIDPIISAVVIVALLLRRREPVRRSAETSSWQAVADVRPVPPELRLVPEVRITTVALTVAVVVLAVALPHVLNPAQSLLASAMLIFAIVGLSLLVLTGWAGQVSLGQMGFVALGAALGGVATGEWGLDLSLALLVSGTAGAVTAILVGLPALRLRGMLLAVTTFAFGLTMSSFFLNRRFFDWIPTGRIERPPLFGVIDYDSPTGVYYLVLACLVIVAVGLRGVRASRAGRVMIAVRENEASARSFAVHTTRVKLMSFALSGFIAAFAGCLFVHHQQAFGPQTYLPFVSFEVFIMVVIGGLGSMVGVLLGALYVNAADWFLPSEWRFLASSLGVVLVLMILPSGLAGGLYRLRDHLLRLVARRRDIVVPSLVADRGEAPLPQVTDTDVESPASPDDDAGDPETAHDDAPVTPGGRAP
jgi:branched-chain amino acid transport system permease protein